MYSRFAALPDAAQPLQRSQLIEALFTGIEIIRLRHIAPRLGVDAELAASLTALARGNSAAATAQLALIDRRLAVLADQDSVMPLPLQARSGILALSDVLTLYPTYFDAGAPA